MYTCAQHDGGYTVMYYVEGVYAVQVVYVCVHTCTSVCTYVCMQHTEAAA